MEKLKVTHDHSLTDILKVLIFAIVLLMPFLVYTPTALYYGFNEHATGTTTVTEGGWTVTGTLETNEVNTSADLELNKIYHADELYFNEGDLANNDYYDIKIYSYETYSFEADNTYLDEYIISNNYNANENNYLNINMHSNSATIYFTNGNTYMSLYCHLPNIYLENVDFVVTTNINNFIYAQQSEGVEEFYKSDFNIYTYQYNNEVEIEKNITQMMEKNWDDLWNTNLFKWTDTSILKNGLDNFTQAFGITNTSHINNLIAYELIMVGVYIVIDIVLALFKWLTHMIGNK